MINDRLFCLGYRAVRGFGKVIHATIIFTMFSVIPRKIHGGRLPSRMLHRWILERCWYSCPYSTANRCVIGKHQEFCANCTTMTGLTVNASNNHCFSTDCYRSMVSTSFVKIFNMVPLMIFILCNRRQITVANEVIASNDINCISRRSCRVTWNTG